MFLLDPPWSEDEIRQSYPRLWKYLEEGINRGINQGYLCSHRKLWYKQEERPPVPLVCTYLGRSSTKCSRPFRFILNNSKATAANVYLMLYPKPLIAKAFEKKPELKRQVWKALNSLHPDSLLKEGRVYGGGLHKLEPKELGNVSVNSVKVLLSIAEVNEDSKQLELFPGA